MSLEIARVSQAPSSVAIGFIFCIPIICGVRMMLMFVFGSRIGVEIVCVLERANLDKPVLT